MDRQPVGDKRIYLQLAMDPASAGIIETIGRNLPEQQSGRLLPTSELHVTLIHFGKTVDVLRSIRRVQDVSDERYASALDTYLERTESLITDETYRMKPLGYARFGERHGTLVGTYEAPETLKEIHANAYQTLLHFLGDCGIRSAHQFADEDPNFRFASSFNPHVTIYKGYEGEDPTEPLPEFDARFMKLEY